MTDGKPDSKCPFCRGEVRITGLGVTENKKFVSIGECLKCGEKLESVERDKP